MLNTRYVHISIMLPITVVLYTVMSLSSLKTVEAEAVTTQKNTSSAFEYSIESKKIDRKGALEQFFKKYKSPLANHADTFVKVADKYGMDYKLMPSIACLESSCAQRLIPGTYNPFGWGKGRIIFTSYDEAIERVGEGLNKIYLSRGLTSAELIAPVYNPPSPLTWTKSVNYFIGKIEEISLNI